MELYQSMGLLITEGQSERDCIKIRARSTSENDIHILNVMTKPSIESANIIWSKLE